MMGFSVIGTNTDGSSIVDNGCYYGTSWLEALWHASHPMADAELTDIVLYTYWSGDKHKLRRFPSVLPAITEFVALPQVVAIIGDEEIRPIQRAIALGKAAKSDRSCPGGAPARQQLEHLLERCLQNQVAGGLYQT
jgi:hypothetical protein